MKNKKNLVFLATLNEAENIVRIITHIKKEVPDADILIVDDSSTDFTVATIRLNFPKDKSIQIVERPARLGLGSAHLLAMLFSVRGAYDSLVTMDADYSHNPTDIPRLLDKLNAGYDFVIGSRYMSGGSCEYTGYRKIVSLCAAYAARLLLGINLYEFTTSFRAFNVLSLKNFDFSEIQNEGYSFFMETVYRLHKNGFTMTEIPICFKDREYGQSKIPPNEIFRGIINLLILFLSRFEIIEGVNLRRDATSKCNDCSSEFVTVSCYPLGSDSIIKSAIKYARGCIADRNKPLFLNCHYCGSHQVVPAKNE